MTPSTDQPAPETAAAGRHMAAELASQPALWERACAEALTDTALPPEGSRVAVVGCGTSWFMAQSYAAAREASGQGETDAFAASEASVLATRRYDAIVAITRSGTTSEILSLLTQVKGSVPTVVVLGDPDSPAAGLADAVVALPYADESSVVQTRFATTALAYLLTAGGTDLAGAVADARQVLAENTPPELLDAEQFSFLGTGWTVGLAHEAALKMREGVQGWTESYPAMEYRHGPIAIAAPGRVTWLFGPAPDGLAAEVTATGASFVASGRHPLADLVQIHKLTLERALARGLDPDLPRNLSRSVILEA